MPLHDHPYSDVNIIYSVMQTGERTTDRGTNSGEAGNDEIQNVQREKFYFVGVTF
jgi:hypothetical protein